MLMDRPEDFKPDDATTTAMSLLPIHIQFKIKKMMDAAMGYTRREQFLAAFYLMAVGYEGYIHALKDTADSIIRGNVDDVLHETRRKAAENTRQHPESY